jgi:hypothetical protein
MKRPSFPDTHHYVFELTLGINSVLTFSAGDISTLFVDGLFALDEKGLLFPGVTVPEDRLRIAGMQPIGYERSARGEPLGSAYRNLMMEKLPKWRLQLRERLDETVGAMDYAVLRQRMLMAKLSGLTDRCLHAPILSDEDRKTAEALLAAAEAIIASVGAATKPVL